MNSGLRAVAALCIALAMGSAQSQVAIDGEGTYEHDISTAYLIDGVPVSFETYLSEADGYTADFEVDSTDDTLSTGRLRRIHLRNNLKGLVTSTDPLTVLNIPVIVTADTKLRNLPDGGVSALQVGDSVIVSGFPAPDSSVLALRIGYSASGFDQWKLSGFVEALSASGLTVGPQEVEVPPDVSLAGCDVDDFAAIKARPLPAFEPGQVLDTVQSVRCTDDYPWADGIPAAIHGFITEVLDDRTFRVGTITIELDDETRFIDGDPTDIKVGIKVAVRGLVTSGTRTIRAVTVKFKELRVEATGPLHPASYDPGRTLAVLGIQFAINDQTRIDPRLGEGALEEAVQVEVRGFFDSAGNAYASRVKVVGDPDRQDVELRGHVSQFGQPRLTLAGVDVDTTDSEFEVAGQPAEAEDFFELLEIGSVVEVSDASYDSQSGLISGGLLTLTDRDRHGPPKDRGVRVDVYGPISAADYVPGKSVTVLGIRFALSPHTAEFPLSAMNGPVTDTTQVQVRGILYGDRLVARRIERMGPGQYDNVGFSGPLTHLSSPEIGMLGAAMDISQSTLINFDSVEAFFEAAQLGQRVVVDSASLNPQSQLITGGEVQLRQVDEQLPKRIRVGAQAPVEPEAVAVGEGLTVMGIRFVSTPWTRDPDGVVREGLSELRQLRVRGVLMVDENLILATHIKVIGAPDFDSAALRGPVGSIDAPEFEILGVTVDVSESAFEEETSDGRALSIERFFELLRIGSLVQIKRATYDPALPGLSGGLVELEDPHRRVRNDASTKATGLVSLPRKAQRKLGALEGFGVGTIDRADEDIVFRAAFD